MQCEFSGKEVKDPSALIKVRIEGVEMMVLPEYAKFGTRVVQKPATKSFVRRQPQQESIPLLDSQYARKIKQKRESMNMRHADFARFLNIKESMVHQLESGHLKPSDKVLAKLKDKLGLNLLVRAPQEVDMDEPQEKIPDKVTLGDLMKK